MTMIARLVYNGNNSNSHDSVCRDVIMACTAIARVHPVHLMNIARVHRAGAGL